MLHCLHVIAIVTLKIIYTTLSNHHHVLYKDTSMSLQKQIRPINGMFTQSTFNLICVDKTIRRKNEMPSPAVKKMNKKPSYNRE